MKKPFSKSNLMWTLASLFGVGVAATIVFVVTFLAAFTLGSLISGVIVWVVSGLLHFIFASLPVLAFLKAWAIGAAINLLFSLVTK